MKKKFILLLLFIFLITGCGSYNKNDLKNDLDKKIKNITSYKVEGDLEIVNNEEVYNYDVDVLYKKNDYYKVSLINKSNKYEQILLKNDDGVFILTPALNKSFKFQSDWPNTNSQVYLVDSIIKDISDDDNFEFKKNKNNYVVYSDVNYPNNNKLTKQKVVFDKKLNIKEAKVLDENEVPMITMKFDKITYNKSINKKEFNLNNVMKTTDITEGTMKDDEYSLDSIYPLNVPGSTKLVDEEKVSKTNGERVILTYDGDKPFLLVEETANYEDELTVVPTFGEPYMLMDVFGTITSNSLSWISGGVEYYLVSDVLNQQEIVDIAQSISSIPTMK